MGARSFTWELYSGCVKLLDKKCQRTTKKQKIQDFTFIAGSSRAWAPRSVLHLRLWLPHLEFHQRQWRATRHLAVTQIQAHPLWNCCWSNEPKPFKPTLLRSKHWQTCKVGSYTHTLLMENHKTRTNHNVICLILSMWCVTAAHVAWTGEMEHSNVKKGVADP